MILRLNALWLETVSISTAGTVPPAITAALEAEDWEGAVRPAVCLGGDMDILALCSRCRGRSDPRPSP